MAEEKKSPNLKDRLKKTTQVGVAPPAAAPADGAVAAPVAAPIAPPPGFPSAGGDVAPPVVPGIPGLGGDVAPPAFVQQQQAAAAAAARARAAADDPFAAAVSAPSGPQEVRLVFDDKPVDDKEVGRSRAGTMVAIAATAVIALGGGYVVGQQMQSRAEAAQTVSALSNVRTEVSHLSDLISTAQQKINHAAEQANLPAQAEGGDEQPAAAAQHPPAIDEDLITWCQAQAEQPPFSPDVYAGRVGRLKSDIVGKLTLVQLQLNDLWALIHAHSLTNVQNVRTALQAANPATNELGHMFVTFAAPQGAPGVVAQLVGSPSPAPDAQGHIAVIGPGVPANQTRTIYAGGALTPDSLPTLAIAVQPNVGFGGRMQAAEAQLWLEYRGRLARLRKAIGDLAQSHQQLTDALSGHPSH